MAFSVAAPRARNTLPIELKLLRSTNTFRRKLKTFLLQSAYGHKEISLFCDALSGLRKFRHSKSSVYRWYPQLVRGRFVYDTYRTVEATRSRHGWVHMFMTHFSTVTLSNFITSICSGLVVQVVSALLRGNGNGKISSDTTHRAVPRRQLNFFRTDYMDSRDFYCSENIRFYFLVFLFYTF